MAVTIWQWRIPYSYGSIPYLSKIPQGTKSECKQFRECSIRCGLLPATRSNETLLSSVTNYTQKFMLGWGLRSAEENPIPKEVAVPFKAGLSFCELRNSMCNSSSNLTYTCVSKRMDERRHSSFSAWKAFRPWLLLWLLHVSCVPFSPPSSVYLIFLKSAFFKYTFKTSSPRWHEKVSFRMATKPNQFWVQKWLGFYLYLPQKNGKDKMYKGFRVLGSRVWGSWGLVGVD